MASTAWAAPTVPSAELRDDVRLLHYDPSEGRATTRNALITELWHILRLTNVDVAQSSSPSIMTWAKSCMNVAYIDKLIRPRRIAQTLSLSPPRSPPSSAQAWPPWDQIDATWRVPLAEATSSDNRASSNDVDSEYIAFVDNDFHCRAADLPAEALDRGPLRKYAPLVLRKRGDTRLYHVYFFERVLLFVLDDNGWSSSVSTEDPRSSALHVQSAVHIKDIVDVSYSFSKLGQLGVHGINLLVKISEYRTETATLVISNPSEMISWGSALLLGQHSSDSFLDMFETDRSLGSRDLYDALTAVTRWTSTAVPLDTYGALRNYVPVIIWIDSVHAQIGAYLFDNHLVFIYKAQDDEIHVHRSVELGRVTYVSPSGPRGAALSVDEPTAAGMSTTLVFYFSDDSTAIEWIAMLQDRVDAPEGPVLKKSLSTPTKSRPSVTTPTWYTAGLVFLTASNESDGKEINIGVAIAPEFRSDGLATYAVAQALRLAFYERGAHRVQARVLHGADDDASPDAAWGPFIRNGFAHESTLRKAARHPTAADRWTDVSVLAIIDLEWTRQATTTPQPYTLWDALFARHQRERDALLLSTRKERDERTDGGGDSAMASDIESQKSPMSRTQVDEVPIDISSWVEQQTRESQDIQEQNADSDSEELDLSYALTHR